MNGKTPDPSIVRNREIQTVSSSTVVNPTTLLNPDQIRRLAELIAFGSSAFPPDLTDADRAKLVTEIRQLLRLRLIQTFAEVIATHIHEQDCAMAPADAIAQRMRKDSR